MPGRICFTVPAPVNSLIPFYVNSVTGSVKSYKLINVSLVVTPTLVSE